MATASVAKTAMGSGVTTGSNLGSRAHVTVSGFSVSKNRRPATVRRWARDSRAVICSGVITDSKGGSRATAPVAKDSRAAINSSKAALGSKTASDSKADLDSSKCTRASRVGTRRGRGRTTSTAELTALYNV